MVALGCEEVWGYSGGNEEEKGGVGGLGEHSLALCKAASSAGFTLIQLSTGVDENDPARTGS